MAKHIRENALLNQNVERWVTDYQEHKIIRKLKSMEVSLTEK